MVPRQSIKIGDFLPLSIKNKNKYINKKGIFLSPEKPVQVILVVVILQYTVNVANVFLFVWYNQL